MAGEDTAGAPADGGGESFDPFGPADDEPVAAPPEPDNSSQGQAEPEGVFAPYLREVPEEHRAAVSGYLKDAERNVNTKLQEAASLREQWGPYNDVDLSGIEPEQLASVVAFVKDVGSDPAAYREWLLAEATEVGLIQQGTPEGEPEDEQDLEAYVQSRIDQALSPVAQRLSQFEQSTAEQRQAAEQAETKQQIEQHINSEFEAIQKRDGVTLSEDEQEAILALSEHIEDPDFVQQGYAKLRAIQGNAQTGLVKDKANQPAAPVRSGGQPAPEKPKTFGDVREQALEMMNQAL